MTTETSEINVDVSKPSYIPNTRNNIMFEMLKNTKVSFVVLLIIVIAIYIGIFLLLGNDSQSTESPVSKTIIIVLEIILWIMLIVVVYINFRNMNEENNNFRMNLNNLFDSKIAELEVKSSNNEITEKENTKLNEEDQKQCSNEDGKEVFHIFDNKYDYNEARDVCEYYNSRLATYDEIERAYENGASWCSYGWSKDQLVLYPVQKAIYNNLKKYPGLEYSCGRPGINGGYSHNKKVKFGVNCYGVKPKPKPNDEAYIHSINHTPHIRNSRDLEKLRNEKAKEHIVAPFNKDKWSNIV